MLLQSQSHLGQNLLRPFGKRPPPCSTAPGSMKNSTTTAVGQLVARKATCGPAVVLGLSESFDLRPLGGSRPKQTASVVLCSIAMTSERRRDSAA